MAPAYGKMVAGLQHAKRRLELLRLQASATTVAGLQHAVHSLELLVRVNVGLTVRARWP